MKKSRFILAVALCGLGFGPVAAQDGAAGYRQTVFTSLPQAIHAAEAAGMVLAIDFYGNMRIVTPAIADMLLAQGFREDSRGVLMGYAPMAFESGWVFAGDSPLLESGSFEISIEAEDKPDVVEEEESTTQECFTEADECFVE